MTNSYKKEYPLAGFPGFGGGAGALSYKSAATKPYVDDVFSTYVYTGNESARSINNGIDLASKGGLVWVKSRNDTHQHHLFDTVRGANEMIASDADSDQASIANRITAFNNNGFTLGSAGQVNGTSAYNYSSWTFRKQTGFFDIVSYTGNGSNRSISHSLGCQPGCIMIKRLDDPSDWIVYHEGFFDFQGSNHYYGKLNKEDAALYGGSVWNNTEPTTTTFRVGTNSQVNQNGGSFIAYLFAGGPDRVTATSRSVQFNGSADRLTVNSSDFEFGTGDFTIECWVKTSSTTAPDGVFQLSDSAGGLSTSYRISMAHQGTNGDNKWRISYGTGTQLAADDVDVITIGQWYHLAYVRSSGVTKLYVNGTEVISVADTTNYNYQYLAIGGYYNTSYLWSGNISNFRIVKGTAVYTSSFKPPTAPLTDITNTKLLCCNNASVTGSTVTPGTITDVDGAVAQIVTPFESPEQYIFGEDEDSDIIKCGTYTGNGTSGSEPVIHLGWEPQFLFLKNVASGSTVWQMVDTTRRMDVTGACYRLAADSTDSESTGSSGITPLPTGFTPDGNGSYQNTNGNQYIYIAIRRPDGYTGKPAEAGTDVFAMDAGAGSSTIPNFDSGFPVDFAFEKTIAGGNSWSTGSRMAQKKYFYTNTSMAEGDWDKMVFDSNTGWNNHSSYGSGDQSWMWKRGQGFDVVAWTGDGGTSRFIPHSLGRVPEMIWQKSRTDTMGWFIGHKGYNGGSDPFGGGHYSQFDTGAPTNDTTVWNSTPTSTHFNVGSYSGVNGSGKELIAFLFASVDDISKVGSYAGSNSEQTITVGFQPRFVWIKNATSGSSDTNYYMLDTVRGWAAGDDKYLKLNSGDAQVDEDFGAPTSTGFTLPGNSEKYNQNGDTFIYYAHA